MNKVEMSVWFYGLVTAAVYKTLFEAGALADINNIIMQRLPVNNHSVWIFN